MTRDDYKVLAKQILAGVTVPNSTQTYADIFESDNAIDKADAIQKALGVSLTPEQKAAVNAAVLSHEDRVAIASELISEGIQNAADKSGPVIGSWIQRIINFLFGWL